MRPRATAVDTDLRIPGWKARLDNRIIPNTITAMAVHFKKLFMVYFPTLQGICSSVEVIAAINGDVNERFVNVNEISLTVTLTNGSLTLTRSR